ncbi:mercuric reductase [Lewinellaceae bacterium SD302]|nr:mercuric reductase [Lewinellaceae bacterium SD302]
MPTHDLLVIGAGSAGLGCAGFAGAVGLKAALIDKTAKKFGGDCLNYGCVPSKALLHVASLFQGGRDATEFGFQASGKADFKKVMEYVHGKQDVIRAHETPEFLREEWGVDTIVGTATLTGPNSLEVNGQTLSAPLIVLATGSKPRQLDVPGADQLKIYDNESLFWELDELPDHLLIIGGGPIACEMGQAFQRLGSQVTIVSTGERLLQNDTPQAGKVLQEKMESEGVEFIMANKVAKFNSSTEAQLRDERPGGGNTVGFTHVLAAIGREVRTEGFGLEAAGVEVREGKIVADEYYRTNVSSIRVIGDAFGREMFSHGAEKHNFDLWNNLLSPLKKKHSLEKFTWVTFTDPEVASFGWTKKDLEEKGIEHDTEELPLEEDDRAIAANYAGGHLTLYLSKGSLFSSPKILGGCMVAPAAGEMIQELHLMNTLELPLSKLTNKIYAYPVGSRINQKAARNRSQGDLLNERNKKLIRGWFRLRY